MQLDHVLERMTRHLKANNTWAVILPEEVLRAIYDHIIASHARDCLELGTAWGATTCVIAAALDELGVGTVTTVDIMNREPVGVNELAAATGLSRHIRPVVLKPGYNWFLMNVLQEQAKGHVCEPCYDFCFLDGAHFWEPDAAAVMAVIRLLRPGGWLLMDDLHWQPRSHPGWETHYAHLTEAEINTSQIGMVYDLLVKTDPELGDFVLGHSGHQGWARKVGGPPIARLPPGIIAGPVVGSWQLTSTGVEATSAGGHKDGVVIEPRGTAVHIDARLRDPYVLLRPPGGAPQPIDYVTLRLRVLSPDIEVIQLFWIGADDSFFDEARSTRCLVRSLHAPQDLTFPIAGTERGRTIRLFRLDPTDWGGEVLLESVTVGRR